MNYRATLLGATGLAFMLSAAAPAIAEAAPAAAPAAAQEEAVAEILVSARKRTERLEDVPISIDVLTADTVERKRIDTLGDVAAQTPGLTFDVGLVPSDTRISIRGLYATRGRPNVAVLVDGVDTSSENFGVAGGGIMANLRLTDIERIEVVKGPQTVLYGRSAFAGAINYITRRPGDTLEAEASALGASFGTYELKGAVGGPIAEGLSARANIGYYSTDGDYTNPVTGGNLNAAENWGGALAVAYEGGSGFKAFARVAYSNETYSERASVFVRSVDPITGAPRTQDGGVLLQSLKPPANPAMPAPKLYSLSGDVSQSESYRSRDIQISGDPNNGGNPYSGTETETWRATLELSQTLSDKVELVSLTGYTNNTGSFNEDFDHTNYQLQANTGNAAYAAGGPFSTLNTFRTRFRWPLPFLPSYGFSAEFDSETKVKQFSQELRLSYTGDRLNFLVDGLYWYEKSDYHDRSQFWLREGANRTLAQFISISQVPAGGRQLIPGFHLLAPLETAAFPQHITRQTDSISLAGSAEYKITDNLTAALEGRVIHDEVEYTGYNFDVTPVNTYAIRSATNNPGQFTGNTVRYTKFNPRVSVAWNNQQGVLLFANWARGTKPGGIDTTDQNGNVTDGEFSPEQVDSFELGGKFVADDGRLVVNASLFYSIYKDQQIGVIDTSGPVAKSRTDNIGESQSKGIEIEGLWSPIDQLFLRAAYAYTHARYTDYLPPTCSNVDSAETQTANCDFEGKSLPFTPENQLNLSARFEQPIGSDMLMFEVDTRFVSKRYMSASNQFWLPSYNQTDVRAGYRFGNINLEAFVDNIFQNDAPRTGSSTIDYGYFDLNSFNLPRAAVVALAPRRSFGVRAGIKF